ncbi:hypothetical protein ABID21_004536 [Pseudorhizobium tarimense]|uniref:Uncharacterized protein n=1 Tax=Pseudorhizobium tarimense TaxID=1079109 RepID=A0ABV2HCW8_9HYPH
MLGDLAVANAHGADRLELDLATGWLDPQNDALMGTVVGLEGGDDIAIDGLPVDLGVEVGESPAQRVIETTSALLVWRSSRLRRVVQEVVGEKLVEKFEVSAGLDFECVAADDCFRCFR